MVPLSNSLTRTIYVCTRKGTRGLTQSDKDKNKDKDTHTHTHTHEHTHTMMTSLWARSCGAFSSDVPGKMYKSTTTLPRCMSTTRRRSSLVSSAAAYTCDTQETEGGRRVGKTESSERVCVCKCAYSESICPCLPLCLSLCLLSLSHYQAHIPRLQSTGAQTPGGG
jgi:hypothetical protein